MNKILTIISILAVCAVFSGCRSTSAKAGSAMVVKHEIKYSNKGTRSEGRSGYLTINGIAIPDCFSTVVADGKVYTFKTKNTTWGDDGYFPIESESVESVYPSLNKNISETDLARGWSEATGRYLNVPANWIMVKWSNGSAAVSSDKIDAFIKAKTLNIIPRNSMFNEMKILK